MSEKILEVENLKKYYGSIKAVDDVSFSIEKGKVYSILGPNGAGKTTTIEIIEGLRKKDSGTIRIFGKLVETIGREEKERIGVQLQETNFFPHLTVEETVELFKSFFRRSLPTEKVFEIAMLEEKRKSYVEKLSGGQRQRLALALALVNDPEIVFLDEPTTGLDPQARRSIWEVIKKLRTQGKTIILTTHYMEEAEELSDYIFIMDHGKIIKEGTLSELVTSLKMQSVVEFEVSGENPLQVFHDFGLENVKKLDNDRFEIETTDSIQALSTLSVIAKENNLRLKNVTIRQPNLEDVFLHLTGRKLRD
jgi:ABC-2 type transport system ATP-binding protein